jgi:hypothetical protein
LSRRAAWPTTAALSRLEEFAGLSISLWLAGIQLLVMGNAGALWRDEVNTVNLARMPSLAAIWQNSHYDSFPILYAFLLHGWMGLGLASDLELRALSAFLGLALVAALWWLAGVFGYRLPLVSLVVFAGSPTVFRFGNGVRAYLLGTVLLLLTMGAIWRLAHRPSARIAAATAVVAVLAVQAYFTNVAMLVALGLAGAILLVRARQWRGLLLLAGVGLAAGLSMLPYLRVYRRHAEWMYLDRLPLGSTTGRLVSEFAKAIDFWLSGGFMFPLWVALVALSIGVFSYRLHRLEPPRTPEQRELALFALASLAAGSICFFAYLRYLNVPTAVWYYLPLMAVLAVVFEIGAELLVRDGVAGRSIRLALVVVIFLATSQDAWRAAHARWTNLDLLAEGLGERVNADDFILVHPWYEGVTFNRYYRGSAAWSTLPEAAVSVFQDHRPIIAKMMERDPIRRILERIEATLRSGHRVWMIGGTDEIEAGEAPGNLPPSLSGGRTGPQDEAYMRVWGRQVMALLREHGVRQKYVTIADPGRHPHFERAVLFAVQGWRGRPVSTASR